MRNTFSLPCYGSGKNVLLFSTSPVGGPISFIAVLGANCFLTILILKIVSHGTCSFIAFYDETHWY